MFSYRNNSLPNKFQGMFKLNTQIHNYNTRTNNLIRIPLVRTKLRQFSIQYQGPTIFTSLENEILNSVSYAAFTRKLKNYLPKSLNGFQLYATSANKCQHCCGSMQTDARSLKIVGPNNVGCCWPTMLDPFAWAFKHQYCYMELSTHHLRTRHTILMSIFFFLLLLHAFL